MRGRARFLGVTQDRDADGLRLCIQPQIPEALRVLGIEEIDFVKGRKDLLSTEM